MKIYESKPTTRRAKQVWEYAEKLNPKYTMRRLWKNPNCWQKGIGLFGNAWGLWVAEYFDLKGYSHTKEIDPHEVK